MRLIVDQTTTINDPSAAAIGRALADCHVALLDSDDRERGFLQAAISDDPVPMVILEHVTETSHVRTTRHLTLNELGTIFQEFASGSSGWGQDWYWDSVGAAPRPRPPAGRRR